MPIHFCDELMRGLNIYIFLLIIICFDIFLLKNALRCVLLHMFLVLRSCLKLIEKAAIWTQE